MLVDELADMLANMEVDKVADMEVDMGADMEVDKVADMVKKASPKGPPARILVAQLHILHIFHLLVPVPVVM